MTEGSGPPGERQVEGATEVGDTADHRVDRGPGGSTGRGHRGHRVPGRPQTAPEGRSVLVEPPDGHRHQLVPAAVADLGHRGILVAAQTLMGPVPQLVPGHGHHGDQGHPELSDQGVAAEAESEGPMHRSPADQTVGGLRALFGTRPRMREGSHRCAPRRRRGRAGPVVNGRGRLRAAIGDESPRAMSLNRPVIVQTVPIGCINLDAGRGRPVTPRRRRRPDGYARAHRLRAGRHLCAWHRHRPQAQIRRASEGASP
jgi:hypothetical protein